MQVLEEKDFGEQTQMDSDLVEFCNEFQTIPNKRLFT
jgi:hypothetical protein